MSLINDALKRASQTEKARTSRPQLAATLQPASAPRHHSATASLLIGAALVVVLGCSAWFFWHWWQDRNPAGPGPIAANTPAKKAVLTPPPPLPRPVASNPIPVIASITPPVVPKTWPKTSNQPPAAKTNKSTGSGTAPPKPKITSNSVIQNTALTPPPTNTSAKTVINPPVSPPATQTVATVTPPAPQPPTNTVMVVIPPPPIVTNLTPPPNVAQVTPAPDPPPPPPPPKVVQFPPLQLQGIFFRPSNPSALINGRTLFIGDYIGEVKVVAIDHRSVKVELEGATKTIPLH